MLKDVAFEIYIGETKQPTTIAKVSGQCDCGHYTGCLVQHDEIVTCKSCGQVFTESSAGVFAPAKGTISNRPRQEARSGIFG